MKRRDNVEHGRGMPNGAPESERASNAIVICYRRDDSAGWAGRLYDNLCQHFGKSRVFMDVHGIPAGAEFVQYIVGVISTSDVLLAVIGPHWQELKDANGRRKLEDEADLVRLEIQTALAKKVQIVPVLVDAARMPTADALPEPIRGLTRFNALEIAHRRFADDVAELVDVIEKVIATATRPRSQNHDHPQSSRGTTYPRQTIIGTSFLSGAVAGAIVGFAYYVRYHSRYPSIGLTRVALVITYGMFVGTAFGATIQFGIPALQRVAERHSLIPQNRWADALFFWAGAVFLCALTGIFAGALCALFFWALSGGPPVSWALVVFGFLIATVAIASAAIFDEYKCNLQTVSHAIQVSVGVWFGHFAIGTLVVLAFDNALNSAFYIHSFGAPPLVAGCLIAIMIGALMGSQMSVTVLLFRSWQQDRDRRDAGGVSDLRDTPDHHTHSRHVATRG